MLVFCYISGYGSHFARNNQIKILLGDIPMG